MTNAELFQAAVQKLKEIGAPEDSMSFTLGEGKYAGRARVDASWADKGFPVPFDLNGPIKDGDTIGLAQAGVVA
jgi:hypothetical protein